MNPIRARSYPAMARPADDYEREQARRLRIGLFVALVLEAGVFLFLLVGAVGCLYLLGMATQP